jgi:hypothetical protein
MSHWSISEHTDNRLVAQSTPRQATASWTIKIVQAVVIISAYCPAVASLVSGSALLPATAICDASKVNVGVMDCQVSRNFWGRVVRKDHVYLPEVPAQHLNLQADGDATMFHFGLFWLIGVSGTVAAMQLLKTRKINWIFDQAAGTIQKQPLAIIPKKTQTFDRSNISSLRLEIPDLELGLFPDLLSLHLNLLPVESTEKNTWYQPAISIEVDAARHQELPAVLQSIVKPIEEVLKLPWQLVFEHETEEESFIFDFVDRTITQQFQKEQVLRLSFDEISGFEAEEPDPFINSLIQTEKPSLRRLNLLVGGGIRIAIHQYAGFTDITNAEIWFHQLQAALQPYFPEAAFTNKVPMVVTVESSLTR